MERRLFFIITMFSVISLKVSFQLRNQIQMRGKIVRFDFRMMSRVSDPNCVVPSGLVAVHKPQDWTSSGVVARIRNVLSKGARDALKCSGKVKIKVGHGGTLDPMAEGVLVLGVGCGTKLMGDYLSGTKGYRAEAMLGTETDTLDATGNITRTIDSTHVTSELLLGAIENFRGDIMQIPPMFSALQKDGKRLYELARQGIEVERSARPVTVYELSLLEIVKADRFSLNMQVSGGFYVRSLIEDLARSVDGAAHMTALVRTKQGPFELFDCIDIDSDYDDILNALERCSAKAGVPDGLRPAALIDPSVEYKK
jgi:tRNA pseudouridine55 synthase